MGGDELLIGVECVGLGGGLPVAIFGKLLDSILCRNTKLAIRVLTQEILIGLGGIGGLSGLPVFGHMAAPRDCKRDSRQYGDQHNMRLAHPFLHM